MSTSYYMYAAQETKDGNLICINPVFRHGDKTTIAKTYESWSRSYFGEAAEKLENIGMRISYDELPDELKEKYSFANNENVPIYLVEFDDIERCIPKGQEHEYHGVYSKDRIFAFESGDIEELYEDDVSAKNFSKMDPEYKKKYAYYEWDAPYGWFRHFKKILEHLKWTIYEWESDSENKVEGDRYYLILFIF